MVTSGEESTSHAFVAWPDSSSGSLRTSKTTSASSKGSAGAPDLTMQFGAGAVESESSSAVAFSSTDASATAVMAGDPVEQGTNNDPVDGFMPGPVGRRAAGTDSS